MSYVATLLVSICLGAAAPTEAPRIARQVLDEFRYQRHLFPPAAEEPSAPEPSSGQGTAEDAEWQPRHPQGEDWSRERWREKDKSDIHRYQGRPDERGWPQRRRKTSTQSGGGGWSGLAVLLEILVWIALAVLAGTVIATLVRSRQQRKRKTTLKVVPVEEAKAELVAPLSEAERLAQDGRFEEAVHVLLLKTIEALVTSQPQGVPEAWTSREIQRAFSMPDAAREPFGTLVDVVEESLFGGRPVDNEAWSTCQERFQAFERAYRGASA